MSRRLIELADGMLASAEERLAPDGLEIDRHFLQVARRLAEAEVALARLDDPPSPFEDSDERVRVSAASYAVMEAALAFWGLAVRLRARFTGAHARRASQPLRVGLTNLAAQVDEDEGGPELLGRAARSLAFASAAVEAAEHEDHARRYGVRFDELIEQLVGTGVLSLLRVAVAVQEDSEAS
ncbi:MAG: hypothetical protein WKF96_02690 [Solirubrobacteraceae bacterium]